MLGRMLAAQRHHAASVHLIGGGWEPSALQDSIASLTELRELHLDKIVEEQEAAIFKSHPARAAR